MRALFRRLATLAAAAGLLGCAGTPSGPQAEGWHAVPIPGKQHTRYAWTQKEGRPALAAVSERSASMWRRRTELDAALLGDVSFSWWVQDLVPDASVADVDREDAPARVLFGFGGDVRKLPQRTRMMFDLAQALTGEAPPYATLMYVWDASAPVGSVIVNPRTDRIRKIVVDSGTDHLRQWRDHRRNLAEDFRRAFGEEPGPLVSIAVMTDSDNTRSQARSWYGPVTLVPPASSGRSP